MLDTGIPTFMAIACDTTGKGPAAVVALSSSLNAETGLLKAIMEIGQVYPHVKNQMKRSDYNSKMESIINFKNVRTLLDHELLYTSDKMLIAFDFLLKNERKITLNELPNFIGNVDEYLNNCVDRLRKINTDVISINITTPDIASIGFSVNRVIIKGFQPIHFGYNEERLGGNRLFEIPVKMELNNHKLSLSNLNIYPHPLG